jgi:phosphatidate cytidylyltransferase
MIRQRIISAIVITVLLVAVVLLLSPRASATALTLILLLAAFEWSTFVSRDSVGLRAAFVVVTVLASALLWWLSASALGLGWVLGIALLFWLLAALWVFVCPRYTGRFQVAVAGVLALSLAWVTLTRMRLDWVMGGPVVMYALLTVWLADSGAYFSGRRWGVKKLAPEVSPGKTWAGLYGGLVACVLLALGVAFYARLPVLNMVMLSLLTGLASVVGDLTESLCKRFAGLKDSGTLIPGHGGVLDRFDSLLATAPVLMAGVLGFRLLDV